MHTIRTCSALASVALLLMRSLAAQITADDLEAIARRPPWTPTASEVEIAFRVDFPEGALEGENARLVLEASEPDNGDPLWGFLYGGTFAPVDSAHVTDGQIVQLRMPADAESVRVRLEASYMTQAITDLDGVEAGRPPIVIRPSAASKIRVVIKSGDAGEIDMRTLDGTTCTIAVADGRTWQPQSWSTPLVVNATGGAELLAVPCGATLSLPTIGAILLKPGEGLGLRPPTSVGLTGYSLHVGDAPDQVWHLRAVRLALFEGRIENTIGVPLAHASVRIPLAQGLARAGPDGHFRILAWPQLESGVPLNVSAFGHPDWKQDLTEPIVGGQTLDLGTIQLERHPAIAGRLTLSDGRPVAGFPLTISPSYPKPKRTGTELCTGPDGRFRFETVTADSVILRGWARLDASGETRVLKPDGIATAYEMPPLRVEAGTADLELIVRPVHAFEGRVEFDDGAPVQTVFVAAQIRALPGTDHVYRGGGQIAAELPVVDGRFVWDRMPAGRWKIFVSSHGSKRVWKTLDFDVHSAPPVFQLERTGALTGRVLTAEGTPVAGAHVVAVDSGGKSYSSRTGDTGAFGIAQLSFGDYSISAWTQSARTHAIECVVHPRGVATDDHELRFPAGPKLTVAVVDPSSGEAVHWAMVAIKRSGVHVAQAPANAQGLARFGPLEPGDYEIFVPDPGQWSMESVHATPLHVAGDEDIEITVTVR